MSLFQDALTAAGRNEMIPDQDDLFGSLVGSWDFEWNDRNHPRTVAGEWHFAWVLEGTAIQDIFICPSRATREQNPQADGEYGTTLRFYNPQTGYWDVAYGCTGKVSKLEARREGEKVVLTKTDDAREKWVFAAISEDRFHWQNIRVKEDGTWHINADLYAVRRG